MNILNENERAALLRSLTDAPDEVLVDAVRQRKEWMKNIRSSFDEVRNFVGLKVTETVSPPAPAVVIPAVKSTSQETASRSNKSPGQSAITKIGTKTKDEIIDCLKRNKQPHSKYEEHLKLLHNRGEVKYDGDEYYV